MATFLGDQFFRRVQLAPIQHEHAGRQLTIEAWGPDHLRVTDGNQPVAVITRYTESESGILPARYPLDVLAPIFRTLEDALSSLISPGQ